MNNIIKQALEGYESASARDFLEAISVLPSNAKKSDINKIAKRFSVDSGIVKHIQDYYQTEDLSAPLPVPSEKLESVTKLAKVIHKAIKKYVVCQPYEAKALTLWVLQTWFVDHVRCVPYLIVNSPEPECGKTQLLKLLQLCCRKSCYMPSITAATITRVLGIDTPPTLLIDEADSNVKAFKWAADVINDGYERGGQSIKADLNDQKKVITTKTFSNKAIGGIDIVYKLNPAVISRSVVICLQQVVANDEKDPVEDLTLNNDKADWEKLRSCLYRIEMNLGDPFEGIYRDSSFRLDFPKGVKHMRQKKIWRGIFSLAHLVKQLEDDDTLLVWAQECMKTFISLKFNNEDKKTRLRSNMKELLSSVSDEFLPTRKIVALLNKNEEWGWRDENNGKGASDRTVTDFLSSYHLHSQDDPVVKRRGFYVKDLKRVLNSN